MSAIAQALTDKDFLAAHPDDQKAYLSHIDPDFAKGAPEDQNAYLNHILAPGRLAKAAQPTQFEKERPGPNHVTQPGEGFLQHAGSAIRGVVGGLVNTPLSPAEAAVSAVGQAKQFASDDLARQQEGRSLPYRIAAPIAQSVVPGLNPRGMEEAANKGDTAGILGEAAVPAAAAVTPLAIKGAGTLRGKIGEGIHTAEGELKPIARTVGQVGGGLAGSAYGMAEGHPYAAVTGGAAGYKLGPSLMEKMFPAPAPKPVYPGAAFPEAGEFYANKGAEMNAVRRQTEMSERQAARQAKANAPEPPLGSPENPGFHSKIPTRMPKPAPVETPTPESGTPENPGWHSKVPNRMPSRVSVAPETPTGEGPALPKAQVVKLPVPHEPLPGENPGYMSSIPRGRLLDLGRQGRAGAGQQLQNIGKSVLYVPEEYPGPRRIGVGQVGEEVPKSVYRVQDVGSSEINPESHAHATESLEEAKAYRSGREAIQGKPQEIRHINPRGFAPEHMKIVEGPRGNRWVKFGRNLKPEDYLD